MINEALKELLKINYQFVQSKFDYLKNSKDYKFQSIHWTSFECIEEMHDNYSPVFILSTGRSGTKFLSLLFDESKSIDSYHEPEPTLQYFCNYAYHNQHQTLVLNKMFDAARMELILNAYIKNKLYLETNQCMTFFAPQIKNLFRKSKFVHIIRHPGDFARSGIRKGWYKNDSIWETGRIRMHDEGAWAELEQIEKMGWLWNATNEFIENFKQEIDDSRVITVKMEDLVTDPNKVSDLLDFMGISDIPRDDILKIQNKKINEPAIEFNEPPNMKKVKKFPKYAHWDVEMQNKLKLYAKDLAESYGYNL